MAQVRANDVVSHSTRWQLPKEGVWRESHGRAPSLSAIIATFAIRGETGRFGSIVSRIQRMRPVVWSDEGGGKVLREKTAEMEKLPLDWTSAAFWITPPFGHCDLNGGSRETRKKIFRIEDFVSHNSPHKFYKVEQYPLRRENLNLSNA